MKARTDLTRWNRAGLTRFRYVDGNAVEYLEILRQQLVEKFADPQTKRCLWLNPPERIPANEVASATETLTERQERLHLIQERILASYRQDRRDWAWEIARAFARACHMLTEHADAYANERFLGTATQWDHVRRLVAMLDYHPAPPASAATRLVLIAKGDQAGTVAKGFQVKHAPPDGGAKVVFETLEDLLIDPALNVLRPKGWNKSDEPPLRPPSEGAPPPPAEDRPFSTVASGPVIHLQGVGETWASQLDALAAGGRFRIKDFVTFDPDATAGLTIGPTRLKEFKATATALSQFELEPGWSEITDWRLPRIASAKPEEIIEITGKSSTEITALQQRIALAGVYLDHEVYTAATLRDLLRPGGGGGAPDSKPTSWVGKHIPKVKPNQVAMVYDQANEAAEGVWIDDIAEKKPEENSALKIHLRPSPVQFTWAAWRKGDIALQYAPRFKRRCWLNGSNVIRTEAPHGLAAGAFIGWQEEDKWRFAEVEEADKRNLRLNLTGLLPDSGTALYEARPLEGPNLPAEVEEVGLLDEELPADAVEGITAASLVDDSSFDFPEVISTEPIPSDMTNPLAIILSVLGKLPEVGSFIVPTPLLPIDIVKAAVKLLLKMGAMVIPSTGEPVFEFIPPEDLAIELYGLVANEDTLKWKDEDDSSSEGPIESNPIVLEIKNALSLPEGPAPVFFNAVKQVYLEKGPFLAIPQGPEQKAMVAAGSPRFVFDGRPDKIDGGDWVVGRFSDGLRALSVSAVEALADGDNEAFGLRFDSLVGNEGEFKKVYADFRGELAAEGGDRNDARVGADPLELEDEIPPNLKVGRSVLLTAEGKPPVAARIKSIEGNAVVTEPPADDFAKGELIIRGNVVMAGHGEGKPPKILGSGDAARSLQEFTLAVAQVSFTPDPTQKAGVAAAIDVEVAGRVWEQVSTLKDSAPDDHHYIVRMTEDGFVKIMFGDGEHGRRLPTGKNNVRVRYRVGSGLAGNVPAGSLEKPIKPHPLVAAVVQPLKAAGGGDMEDVAALRENAPATLLALERAVSLSDFAHLAASQSSVWQARAYRQVVGPGVSESVRVVIVPADGVHSPEVDAATRSFLQNHALPGVVVHVEPFDPVTFDLNVTLRVRLEAFVAEEVASAVAKAVTETFTLKERKLGAHLYLSEIYKVVEGVKGVENSICVLNDDPALQRLDAKDDRTVVFLDTAAEPQPSKLVVVAEEYRK